MCVCGGGGGEGNVSNFAKLNVVKSWASCQFLQVISCSLLNRYVGILKFINNFSCTNMFDTHTGQYLKYYLNGTCTMFECLFIL